tara:strand:+ start:626 stop:880 length:255 start_codon:yes stop_codon:yes gene_type:complete
MILQCPQKLIEGPGIKCGRRNVHGEVTEKIGRVQDVRAGDVRAGDVRAGELRKKRGRLWTVSMTLNVKPKRYYDSKRIILRGLY